MGDTNPRRSSNIALSILFFVIIIGLSFAAYQFLNRNAGAVKQTALIGDARSQSSYPFRGPVKIFGQRSITQTAAGAIVGNRVFHPAGLAVDSRVAGTPAILYVADAINNRILAYRSLNGDRNQMPDKVFGQSDFTSGACNGDNNIGVNGNTNASKLCFADYPKITNVGEYRLRIPMVVDLHGNLYVADIMNNRILRFNEPFSTDRTSGKGDTVADYVWGQTNFTERKPNRGGGITSSSLALEKLHDTYGPGLAIDDAGNLWVSDTNNSRVLRFPVGTNGVPNPEANKVLGQTSFTTGFDLQICDGGQPYINGASTRINTPANRLCFPGALAFDSSTKTLYVADLHTTKFRTRLLAFTDLSTDTVVASEIIINNPSLLPFTTYGYTFRYYSQIWSMTLNTDKTSVSTATGVLWIVEDVLQRAILIDAQGNIVKVVNAIDLAHRGNEYNYGVCRQNDFDNGHQRSPGSVAMDKNGNLYLGDNVLQKVSVFNAAQYEQYEIGGKKCLPARGIQSLFGRITDGGQRPNTVDNYVYNGAVGAVTFKDPTSGVWQLIGKGGRRFMVWNNYRNKPSGAPADFVLGQFGEGPELTQPENTNLETWAYHAIDGENRLWTIGGSNDIIVYQLPLTSNSIPIARYTIESFFWSNGQQVNTPPAGQRLQPISFAYDKRNNRLWVNDGSNNRLLGFKANQAISLTPGATLVIDKVIGQPNSTTFGCNATLTASWEPDESRPPTAQTLCQPTVLKFDKLGNLYVLESAFEGHGNNRIVMYSSNTLSRIENDNNIFPFPAASKVFIKNSFTEYVPSGSQLQRPDHPTGIAFTSHNQMIVGTDGYYAQTEDRATNQLFFYNNPLAKNTSGVYLMGQLPDAVIPLPLGASGELDVDSEDTLIVQDHTWPRILLLNFKNNPEWLFPVHQGASVGSLSIAWPGDDDTISVDANPSIRLSSFNLRTPIFYSISLRSATGEMTPLISGVTATEIPLSFSTVAPGYYMLIVEGKDSSGIVRARDMRRISIVSDIPEIIERLPITITSPLPNATYTVGDTIPIRWTSTSLPAGASVNVHYIDASTITIANVPAQNGEYLWKPDIRFADSNRHPIILTTVTSGVNPVTSSRVENILIQRAPVTSIATAKVISSNAQITRITTPTGSEEAQIRATFTVDVTTGTSEVRVPSKGAVSFTASSSNPITSVGAPDFNGRHRVVYSIAGLTVASDGNYVIPANTTKRMTAYAFFDTRYLFSGVYRVEISNLTSYPKNQIFITGNRIALQSLAILGEKFAQIHSVTITGNHAPSLYLGDTIKITGSRFNVGQNTVRFTETGLGGAVLYTKTDIPSTDGKTLVVTTPLSDIIGPRASIGVQVQNPSNLNVTTSQHYNYGWSNVYYLPVVSGATSQPGVVSEQVLCVFNGVTTKQQCYSRNMGTLTPLPSFGCSGVGTCTTTMTGPAGSFFEWRNSCGDTNKPVRTLDGSNKTVTFNCPAPTLIEPIPIPAPVTPTISTPTFSYDKDGIYHRLFVKFGAGADGKIVEIKQVSPTGTCYSFTTKVAVTGKTGYSTIPNCSLGTAFYPTGSICGIYLQKTTTQTNACQVDIQYLGSSGTTTSRFESYLPEGAAINTGERTREVPLGLGMFLPPLFGVGQLGNIFNAVSVLVELFGGR